MTTPDVRRAARDGLRSAVKGKRSNAATALRALDDLELDTLLEPLLDAVVPLARTLPAPPPAAALPADDLALGVVLCPSCHTYRPRESVKGGRCEECRA